jgi:hypothetical protein
VVDNDSLNSDNTLGADHLIFEGGGGGLEGFEKKFPAIQVERKKNHAAYNREKNISCKERAQKKFLHVNLLTFFTSVLCLQAGKILHF